MKRLPVLLAAIMALAAPSAAHAYRLFGPYPWDEDTEYYNKWGDIFTPGGAGGTITWSLMPDGTAIDPGLPEAADFAGTSSLQGLMTGLGYAQALAAIERSFDRWGAVANIYFERVPDAGLAFASLESNTSPTVGHIRVGAFEIVDSFAGAVGYAPPPNGPRVEGDIVFNSANNFQLSAGQEGDLIVHPGGVFHNEFEGLFMHELGRALGLDHSDVISVMSIDPAAFERVNRELDVDDVAGVQFMYGPRLLGDFDHDNAVDGDDLSLWTEGFGTTPGATYGDGDADGDGDVDGSDFVIWQRELGDGLVAATVRSAPVPEPAFGIAITAIAAIGLFARRRPRARRAVKSAR